MGNIMHGVPGDAKAGSVQCHSLMCLCVFLERIDHWDFEQERLVLLSENSVISCSFNFRFKYIKEWKAVPLQLISDVVYGQPVYPSYAVVW